MRDQCSLRRNRVSTGLWSALVLVCVSVPNVAGSVFAAASQPLKAAESQPAQPETENPANDILAFRVVSEQSNQLVVDVDYTYSGDHGQTAFLSVSFGITGTKPPRFEFKPAKIDTGRGTARITVTCKPESEPVYTHGVFFRMSRGQELARKRFDHKKIWSLPGATIVKPSPRKGPDIAARNRDASAPHSQTADPNPTTRPMAARDYVHWAIVGTPEVEKTGIVDLLTTALWKEPGIKLVEREQIAAVTRELAIVESMGSKAATGRLRLGQLLKADALILLAIEPGDTKEKPETLRVVLSETTYGARLQLDSRPHPRKGPEQVCADIANLVRSTRTKYPSGVTSIISVPPFVSDNITHDYDAWRDRFAHLLESALAMRPGVAVLEIEESQAIRAEEGVGEGDHARRIMPMFVEGQFQVSKSRNQELIKLKVCLVRNETSQTIEGQVPSVEQVAGFLSNEVAAKVLEIPEADFARSFSPKSQMELLIRRADVFDRRGEMLPSTALREAALLISPRDKEQNEILLRQYLKLAPYSNLVNWFHVPPAEFVASFQQRCGLWLRGVEVFDYMVRNGLIDGRKAPYLAVQVKAAGDDVVFIGDDFCSDIARSTYDHKAAALICQSRDQCQQALRRFLTETVPLVASLQSSGSRPDRERPSQILSGQLLNLALDPHFRDLSHQIDREDLDYYTYVLTRLARPDGSVESSHLLGLLEEIGTNPDYKRRFSNEDFLQFLRNLEASGQQLPTRYAKLGLLLYDYQYGRDGKRASESEALNAFKAWLSEADPSYRRTGKPGQRHCQELLVMLTPLGPHDGPPPAYPPRVNLSNQQITNEVADERVRLKIRRASGRTVEIGPDKNRYSWNQVTGKPVELIDAGSFDLLWNTMTIWVQHQLGSMREIVLAEKDVRFAHVAWDGENIWVMTYSHGIRVYTPNGHLIAKMGPSDGLPVAECGGRLAPISSGHMLAVGSLGVRRRAWCATLTLDQKTLQYKVFHEATVSRERTTKDGIEEDDPGLAFVPYWLYRLPVPYREDYDFLLSCGTDNDLTSWLDLRERYVLLLSPRKGAAESAHFELFERDNQATCHVYWFMPNGDALLAYGRQITHWTHPARRKANEPAVRVLFENNDPLFLGFYGRIFEHEGLLYAPSQNDWARIDPATLTVEHLGIHRQDMGSMQFGVSKRTGLVGWDALGFYRFEIRTTGGVPDEAGLRLTISELDREIQASPAKETLHCRKVSCFWLAGRLEQAKEAAIAWVEACPHSFDAHFALVDVERKLRSGLNPNDESEKHAWALYPHGTFASYQMFRERGVPILGLPLVFDVKPVRLPFASDRTEWHIAELYAFQAAYDYCTRGMYRNCIEVCNRWESECQQQNPSVDSSYRVFRAASYLGLKQYDLARKDARAAVAEQKAGRLWAGGSRELLEAVLSRSHEYRPECLPYRPILGWLNKHPF